jgi:hypothetical protein
MSVEIFSFSTFSATKTCKILIVNMTKYRCVNLRQLYLGRNAFKLMIAPEKRQRYESAARPDHFSARVTIA